MTRSWRLRKPWALGAGLAGPADRRRAFGDADYHGLGVMVGWVGGQNLIFDGLEDLLKCLSGILADPDLSVVRVKNRFAASYPAAASAGYRDVGLQLRLAGAAAEAAGPAGSLHVCELQLQLLPFARAKSRNGHRRYIAFRNAMGS